MDFECENLIDFQMAVEKIAKQRKFNLFLMQGEMGAGKTTFVKKFAKSIGVKEVVNSPTFAIVHQYDAMGTPIYHMDLYRLEKLEDFLEIGGRDLIETKEGICFVEWPEILTPILPENYHRISIKISEGKRTIKFV